MATGACGGVDLATEATGAAAGAAGWTYCKINISKYKESVNADDI